MANEKNLVKGDEAHKFTPPPEEASKCGKGRFQSKIKGEEQPLSF